MFEIAIKFQFYYHIKAILDSKILKLKRLIIKIKKKHDANTNIHLSQTIK